MPIAARKRRSKYTQLRTSFAARATRLVPHQAMAASRIVCRFLARRDPESASYQSLGSRFRTHRSRHLREMA